MTSLSRPRVEFISTILQTVLNLGLLSLGLILVVFLGKETLHLADVLFAPEQTSKYELVEGLVVYFLYFEFIALIVKYFQSGFHFPLRYFVYGLAPIFPYTFYHLTHYWFAAADIPVANDTPVHYADAIRCNVRRPPQGSLPLLTRRVSA